ncbi:MAG: alpha/beta hydrolase [Proteobacteria bacterium]|nr:alpha/beta hydrolase [Pseudomonadota bacterium]
MNHLILATDFGPLYFVGRVHTDKRRPVLFAMGGIWTPDDNLHELVEWFPGASVIVAPLPGMGSTYTNTFEIENGIRTVDQALAALVPDRKIVAFGASTGCLVTLGLTCPQIVRQVALEPFFRTAPLWPFLKSAREMLAASPERTGAFQAAWEIFGLKGDAVTDRDHRHLVREMKLPVDAILGREPLEPERAYDGWPSLTSAEDRAAMAANPLFTLHEGPPGSGHYLQGSPEGEALIKDVLHKALKAAL